MKIKIVGSLARTMEAPHRHQRQVLPLTQERKPFTKWEIAVSNWTGSDQKVQESAQIIVKDEKKENPQRKKKKKQEGEENGKNPQATPAGSHGVQPIEHTSHVGVAYVIERNKNLALKRHWRGPLRHTYFPFSFVLYVLFVLSQFYPRFS